MVSWVESDTAWIFAGCASLLGVLFSSYNIFLHLRFYNQPEFQIHIVRILLIVPLYALISWLTIRYHAEAVYLEIFRDIYEAFVIYEFLILVLEYIGGESTCVGILSLKQPMKHPWPFCCFPKMALNVRFLRWCKISCIQFMVIKPIMAVLSIIMLLAGQYESPGYQIFMLTVYNTAYTIALYGLWLFYKATKEQIKGFSPVRKFLAMKIVVFATYWQSLLVSLAPGMSVAQKNQWNDFILCCEMSVFAFIHLKSFPWWEFQSSYRQSVLRSARSVISLGDVFSDVYHNIMPTYQTYVLQNQENPGETKIYHTRKYIYGNLDQPNWTQGSSRNHGRDFKGSDLPGPRKYERQGSIDSIEELGNVQRDQNVHSDDHEDDENSEDEETSSEEETTSGDEEDPELELGHTIPAPNDSSESESEDRRKRKKNKRKKKKKKKRERRFGRGQKGKIVSQEDWDGDSDDTDSEDSERRR